MANLFEVDHPLIKTQISRLRDQATTPEQFRYAVARLAVLLAYEATKDLTVSTVQIQTPITKTTGHQLADRLGLVPILRAGLGMVDPILNLVPHAEVWHLGLYRDESTAEPVEYYSKLPDGSPVDLALLLDPMLATGGSATAALDALYRWGVKKVKMLSIIAAPEGVARLQKEFPETQIYVCVIDKELNSQKFIVPGLGDAGDRTFNT